MAIHEDLQSLNVEAIEEYLAVAEYCVTTTKANGGIYGLPALLLLFCVVDALTVNSGGKEHTLEQITSVIPMRDKQLKSLREWYRNLLAHQAVIAPGTMLSTVDGPPIEFNSSGEPTYIRVIPFYYAVRDLWESFDRSTLNPPVPAMKSPKTPMSTPSFHAPGITGCNHTTPLVQKDRDDDLGLKRLDFVPPNRSPWEDKGVMLTLSVAKLDAAWHYNRVPPGGERENESKYHNAKKWIRQHGHHGLMASEIAIDEGESHIYFMEGRNRFAALRDLGYRVVKVWAHRDESDELRRKYAP